MSGKNRNENSLAAHSRIPRSVLAITLACPVERIDAEMAKPKYQQPATSFHSRLLFQSRPLFISRYLTTETSSSESAVGVLARHS